MKAWSKRTVWACVTLLAALASRGAIADDGSVLRWQEVIGIIQAGNVVGGIPGGGQPWSTLGGRASASLSGRLRFRVDGLVLAGGNAIGTADGIAQVRGTLVCDPGGADQAVVDGPLVDLSPTGDAEFDGDVGPLPAVCGDATKPVAFLVRIAGAGRWIANGAVFSRNGD
jgi:hypothetical protein